MNKLHEEGYEIIEKAVSITDTDLGDVVQRGKRGRYIFNHNKRLGIKEDRKRKQIHLGSKAPGLNQEIKKVLHERFPKLQPTEIVVLHSKAGCQQQNPHCDYEQDKGEFESTPDELIPLGCVAAVMDNSTLELWPGSMRVRSGRPSGAQIQRQTVSLNAGDLLVFRGDVTHAGSPYDKDNFRLHTYLDLPAIQRNPNRTWPMDQCDTIQD